MVQIYTLHRAPVAPPPQHNWESPAWKAAETAEIGYFYPQSSEYHPHTLVRLLYDSGGIHGIFQVQDCFVRCLTSTYMGPVWQDACVEFFVQPKASAGYFNLEMNCGGALLCSYVVDPRRTQTGFADYTPLPAQDGSRVQISTSLPGVTDPEITTPLTWTLQFYVPFAVFEKYTGPLGENSGQEWRANFNKCAENNSHPHWASWQQLPELNFHAPQGFGRLRFASD